SAPVHGIPQVKRNINDIANSRDIHQRGRLVCGAVIGRQRVVGLSGIDYPAMQAKPVIKMDTCRDPYIETQLAPGEASRSIQVGSCKDPQTKNGLLHFRFLAPSPGKATRRFGYPLRTMI